MLQVLIQHRRRSARVGGGEGGGVSLRRRSGSRSGRLYVVSTVCARRVASCLTADLSILWHTHTSPTATARCGEWSPTVRLENVFITEDVTSSSMSAKQSKSLREAFRSYRWTKPHWAQYCTLMNFIFIHSGSSSTTGRSGDTAKADYCPRTAAPEVLYFMNATAIWKWELFFFLLVIKWQVVIFNPFIVINLMWWNIRETSSRSHLHYCDYKHSFPHLLVFFPLSLHVHSAKKKHTKKLVTVNPSFVRVTLQNFPWKTNICNATDAIPKSFF